MNKPTAIVLPVVLALLFSVSVIAAPKTAAERQAAAKEAAAKRQAEKDAVAGEKAAKDAAAKEAAAKEAAEKEAAAKAAAEAKAKEDLEAERAALQGVGTDGVVLIKKIKFAVKDVTHEQLMKAIPIARAYDAEFGALQAKHRQAHQDTLDAARRSGTRIDLDTEEVKRGVRYRAEHRVEAKWFDKVGIEVLTPPQREAWDAYRLHFTSAFQLAFTGADEEQLKKLLPVCAEVVKAIPKAADGYTLFQQRLAEVKDRAAKQILNDEQRAKYAKIKAGNQDYEGKLDALEKQHPPAAAAEANAGPAPAPAPGKPAATGGDGLD